MSEPQTEPRPGQQQGQAAAGAPEGQGAPKKENVFTRKIGPLPMWVWLAIAAAVVVGYLVLVKGKSKSSSSKKKPQQQFFRRRGFGRFLRPHPPHTHHHRRGSLSAAPEDQQFAASSDTLNNSRSTAGMQSAGATSRQGGPMEDVDVPVGVDRRHKRGEPVKGSLVQFKTAEQGQTPTLADVANHYNTDPEAIVQEAEGRGYPNSVAWKRYIARHDWASPLPPATDFSILAHPG